MFLFSRELRALDELFSREPEDRAEWVGSARSHYAAKREPSPQGIVSKAVSKFSPKKPAPDPAPKPNTIKPVTGGPQSKFAQLEGWTFPKQGWHPIFEGHPRGTIPPITQTVAPPPPKGKRELLG